MYRTVVKCSFFVNVYTVTKLPNINLMRDIKHMVGTYFLINRCKSPI